MRENDEIPSVMKVINQTLMSAKEIVEFSLDSRNIDANLIWKLA